MPSINETLTANVLSSVSIDEPASRIVITMIAVTAADPVYATADGSVPVVPTPGTEVPGSQEMVAPVVGEQTVLEPPIPGGHMALPTVNLICAGAATVSIRW